MNQEMITKLAVIGELCFLSFLVGVMYGVNNARISALEDEPPCVKRARIATERKAMKDND